MKQLKPLPDSEIRGFQQYLSALYGPVNQGHPWEYLYGYLARSVGYLSKSVLERKQEKIQFVRSLSWLMTLAEKVGVDLQTAYEERFPGICPYCLQLNCVCYKTGKQPPQPLAAHRVLERLQDAKGSFTIMKQAFTPFTLDAAMRLQAKIYPHNEIAWHYAGPVHHLMKIHEEVAEIHEATSKFNIGQKPLVAVQDEFADVLGWLLSSWNMVKPGEAINDALVDFYLNGCPVCAAFPCVCQPHRARAEALFDPAFLSAIRKQVEELAVLVPSQPKLRDLVTSLRLAETTQHHPTAILSIRQIAEVMGDLERELDPSDTVHQQVHVQIQATRGLLDAVHLQK